MPQGSSFSTTLEKEQNKTKKKSGNLNQLKPSVLKLYWDVYQDALVAK